MKMKYTEAIKTLNKKGIYNESDILQKGHIFVSIITCAQTCVCGFRVHIKNKEFGAEGFSINDGKSFHSMKQAYDYIQECKPDTNLISSPFNPKLCLVCQCCLEKALEKGESNEQLS